MDIVQKSFQTDVLIVGGGLTGCMAAIRASEIVGSDNVLVVEKANIKRSGNAATGVDHTWSYMPEVHDPLGFTPEQLVEDHVKGMGSFQDQDLIYTIATTIAERIKQMESWGFPLKTDGKYDYVQKIHRVPSFLHWAGRDQKVMFSKELKNRGIKVLNRVFITELLKENGKVVGAIGVGIRKQIFFQFKSKAVILTTGGISRLFPGSTSWDVNRTRFAYSTGDGIAMGYRAGAEVTHLEFVSRWSGVKNLVNSGRGTWIGIMEDADGEPIGRVKSVADPKKIDLSVESPADMIRVYKEGRGPIFMDCIGISDENLAYMYWGLSNEGNILTLKAMEEAGIDPRKERVQFTFYELETTGGLVINAKGETNIEGLFAAGGEVIGNMKRAVSPGAYALGWIAGESAAGYASAQDVYEFKECRDFKDEKFGFYHDICERREGAHWKEALGACQDIMQYYGGDVRYEKLLRAGILHMKRIRERALKTLMAKDPHELMRCLEALNLMDIGEASMLSSIERQETRFTKGGVYVRVDYKEENKEMLKFLIQRLVDGLPSFYWRKPRRII